MPKKIPTRAVPSPLSAEARNFVLQGQPLPEVRRPSVPPPPAEPATPVIAATPVIPAVSVAQAAPAPVPVPASAAPPPAVVAAPAVPPSAAPAAPVSRGRKRSNRTLVSRADGRTLRRLQIYLDADVAKKLKHHCVEHDIDMSAYVNEVLAKALR